MAKRDDDRELAAVLTETMAGMLLVAFRDGVLHWNEKEDIVITLRLLDSNTAHETLAYLDRMAHELEEIPESRWRGLFTYTRDAPPERKRLLLSTCTKIGFSDGHLSAEEGRLLRDIADWIEASATDREVWKRKVREVLKMAEARGFQYTGIENL